MEEYWNQFLNWLNSVGYRYNNYIRQREAKQDREYQDNMRNYPVAPRAEDRYANSWYGEGTEAHFPMSHITEQITQRKNPSEGISLFNDFRPSSIYRYVKDPGDTVYVEQTPYETLGGALIRNYERRASTKRPRGNEYNVLKRRWNTARKLAK